MGTRQKKKAAPTSVLLKNGPKPVKSNMIFEYLGFKAEDYVKTTSKFKTRDGVKLDAGTRLQISRFYLKSEEQRDRYPEDLNAKKKPKLYLAIAFTARDQIIRIPLQFIKPL